MVYPHYGWILFAWYPDNWWTEDIAGEPLDECTDKELKEFLRQVRPLNIHSFPEPDDHDIPTVAGFVSYLYTFTHSLYK